MARVRILLVLVLLLGLGGAAASLSVPVVVVFGDDPILRLVTLDPSTKVVPDQVTCGSPAEGLSPTLEGVSIEALARDRACRRESLRRVAGAGAAGALVLVVALLGMAAAAGRVVTGP